MRLKDGTVYELQEPPFLKEGRFIFTTRQGGVFSLAETEVEEIKLIGPAPAAKKAPNPQDSRALGAIARGQRRARGKPAPVSPAPTPRASDAAKP
jgi:hypothetical protein